MSTTSITHRPMAGTAVAAAFIAALAFAGVAVAQHESGSTGQTSDHTSLVQLPDLAANAQYHRHFNPGVQIGLP